jgi:rhodanese-related sulfurtransferase
MSHNRLAVVATVLSLMLGTGARAGETVAFDRVAAEVASGRMLLVDVREPDEFAAGHVPGSINLPMSRFSPAALPAPEGRSVVLTCQSGRRAGLALAAVEATGRRDVGIYAGSWKDWTAHKGPVATGP